MFCSRCGTKLIPPSRSCPFCGAISASEQLTRPITGGIFGGVCAGFALRYGSNLFRVRLATFFLILFTGIGLFVYLAAWFVIPRESHPSTQSV